MTTFTFHTVDFGDTKNKPPESVWVAAYVDGDYSKGIGAYVYADTRVEFDENDLRAMGIKPDSAKAQALLEKWESEAREFGLMQLAKVAGYALPRSDKA